jgi:hypothetical protein
MESLNTNSPAQMSKGAKMAIGENENMASRSSESNIKCTTSGPYQNLSYSIQPPPHGTQLFIHH